MSERRVPILPTSARHGRKGRVDFSHLIDFYPRSSPVSRKYPASDRRLQLGKNPKVSRDLQPPAPFEDASLVSDVKKIYNPDGSRMKRAVLFLVASVFFLATFLLEVYPKVSLMMSLFCFSISTFVLTRYVRMTTKEKEILEEENEEKGEEKLKPLRERPSDAFLKDTKGKRREGKPVTTASEMMYMPFMSADRASASYEPGMKQLNLSTEASIDQLALEGLAELGISLGVFNQYVTNMKDFIRKSAISKLQQQLNSDDPMVEAMISVPTFEHYREYVIQRIRALSASSYLAVHSGDKGERYKDKEWSSELPSDNQIVLHIFSSWLSWHMGQRRKGQRAPLVFAQKYLAIKKEPKLENDVEILLCSRDWTDFYVMVKQDQAKEIRQYWAPRGRDAMYFALTLFFYFVDKKYELMLESVDLAHRPFCMDRMVFKSKDKAKGDKRFGNPRRKD